MTDRGRPAGITLLELAVVVFIAGALAAVAVPALRKRAIERRTDAVAGDLKAFAWAFRAYAKKHGDWPPGGTPPGKAPPGMEPYLNAAHWSRVTAIGGHYRWDSHSRQSGETYAAVILIESYAGSPVTSDSVQLHDIDRKVDDGRLASGNFILGYRNYPVFVLEH